MREAWCLWVAGRRVRRIFPSFGFAVGKSGDSYTNGCERKNRLKSPFAWPTETHSVLACYRSRLLREHRYLHLDTCMPCIHGQIEYSSHVLCTTYVAGKWYIYIYIYIYIYYTQLTFKTQYIEDFHTIEGIRCGVADTNNMFADYWSYLVFVCMHTWIHIWSDTRMYVFI